MNFITKLLEDLHLTSNPNDAQAAANAAALAGMHEAMTHLESRVAVLEGHAGVVPSLGASLPSPAGEKLEGGEPAKVESLREGGLMAAAPVAVEGQPHEGKQEDGGEEGKGHGNGHDKPGQ